MMPRYIDADALSRYFYERVSLSHWMHSRLNTAEKAMGKTREIIENFPAADVAPVMRGHWERNDNGTWSCSECKSWIPNEQHYYARYCIHCGATMDGGAE